jgi:ATP-dependent protease HslVU (ClpYQ) peptidase subunit
MAYLMTVAVGIVHEGTVYIGADRATSDGIVIMSSHFPKVGINGDIIYSYAGTIGIGQLMGLLQLPPLEGDPYTYIRLTVVEELRSAIESFSREVDHDTSWLIGCQGRLYELSAHDWGVIEYKECTIGSGGSYAFGSLYTSIDKDPIERIGLALSAAITYSPSCQGPIDILSI